MVGLLNVFPFFTYFFTRRPDRTLRPNKTLKDKADDVSVIGKFPLYLYEMKQSILREREAVESRRRSSTYVYS